MGRVTSLKIREKNKRGGRDMADFFRVDILQGNTYRAERVRRIMTRKKTNPFILRGLFATINAKSGNKKLKELKRKGQKYPTRNDRHEGFYLNGSSRIIKIFK